MMTAPHLRHSLCSYHSLAPHTRLPLHAGHTHTYTRKTCHYMQDTHACHHAGLLLIYFPKNFDNFLKFPSAYFVGHVFSQIIMLPYPEYSERFCFLTYDAASYLSDNLRGIGSSLSAFPDAYLLLRVPTLPLDAGTWYPGLSSCGQRPAQQQCLSPQRRLACTGWAVRAFSPGMPASVGAQRPGSAGNVRGQLRPSLQGDQGETPPQLCAPLCPWCFSDDPKGCEHGELTLKQLASPHDARSASQMDLGTMSSLSLLQDPTHLCSSSNPLQSVT